MLQTTQNKSPVEKATSIVCDSGGEIVGRTRLQKIACLLELAGLGEGFSFEYYHYGPYSEELASAVRDASIIGFVREEDRPASWGGTYSVYTTEPPSAEDLQNPRHVLAKLAAEANPIELELAVTAAFLGIQGEQDPWKETENRKPEKAKDGRLEKAKVLYSTFRAIHTPTPLPDLIAI